MFKIRFEKKNSQLKTRQQLFMTRVTSKRQIVYRLTVIVD